MILFRPRESVVCAVERENCGRSSLRSLLPAEFASEGSLSGRPSPCANPSAGCAPGSPLSGGCGPLDCRRNTGDRASCDFLPGLAALGEIYTPACARAMPALRADVPQPGQPSPPGGRKPPLHAAACDRVMDLVDFERFILDKRARWRYTWYTLSGVPTLGGSNIPTHPARYACRSSTRRMKLNARQRHIPTQPPQPVPERRAPLVSLDELAGFLRVHPTQIIRLLPAGLPHVDLAATHTPGRRRKAYRRFDVDAVVRWLSARGGPGNLK